MSTHPKHPGGRPPLPPEARRALWELRLNKQEIAWIEAAAARVGLPPRTFAREVLLQFVRPDSAPLDSEGR